MPRGFDLSQIFEESAELIRHFDLPRERSAWLEFRRTGVGGSDAAALLGVEPNRGPHTIYLHKVGEGPPEDEVWNEPAYWGNKLEDIVAQEFETRVGLKVYHPTHMLRSKQLPFMLATVDRWVVDPEGALEPTFLEIKTRSPFKRSLYADGAVEPKVYAQCQHYMVVAGVRRCHLAVLFGGQNFQWYVVERDDDYCANLVQVESDFWGRVVRRDPPPPDPKEVDRAGLDAATDEVPDAVELDPAEFEELIRKHKEVVKLQRAIDVERRELEAKIKLGIGKSSTALLRGLPVATWKPVVRNTLDAKLLKSELPEVYERFSRPTVARTFRMLASGASPDEGSPE